MADIFGDGGLLAKRHQSFEFRRGQLEMAEIVEEAFAKHQHALIEAGTGTGKTLAYLSPAIRSGRRVVISTATKSLQEQLYHKDIPFLQKHFAPESESRGDEGPRQFSLPPKVHQMGPARAQGHRGAGLVRADSRLGKTDGNRRSRRTEFFARRCRAVARLDARRETCTGQKCAEFKRCFITAMHQRAAEADVIIVNHHLFFADLALRQDDFGSILPEYGAVIFDEAHEIEDVASDYFGAADVELPLRRAGARRRSRPCAAQASAAPLLRARDPRARARAQLFRSFPPREGRFPSNPPSAPHSSSRTARPTRI